MTVPWIARSNQSILKEINPDYSLEDLILRLKPQYFGHLMQIMNPLDNTLVLVKIEGRRRGDRMTWLDSITHPMGMNLSKLQEIVKEGKHSILQFMDCKESTGYSDSTLQPNN